MFKKDMTASMSYLWDPNRILLSKRVDRLSAAQECWYRRALDFSWIDEGLSIDPVETADRIKKKCTPEAAAMILKEFFIVDKKNPQKMVNEKQEELRKKLKKKLRNLSNAGKRSGQKRRENKDLTPEQMFDKSGTNDEQMSGNICNVIKDKKDKKEEEEREEAKPPLSPPKRGTRLPDEFLLTAEMRTWGAENKPSVDLVLETKKFCNHFRAAPGQKGVKLNWRMTWENWILNARGTNGTNQQYGKRTDADVLAESADFYANYDERPIA